MNRLSCDLCQRSARSDLRCYIYSQGRTRDSAPDLRLDLCGECYGQISQRLALRGSASHGRTLCYCGTPARTSIRLAEGSEARRHGVGGYLFVGKFCRKHAAPLLEHAYPMRRMGAA